MRLFLVLAAVLTANVASAKPMGLLGPAPGFEVFAVDAKGGGWVLHHGPGHGDTIWGCADLSAVDSCKQVYLDAWRIGSKISFLHISQDSQKAWMVVKAPGMSDTLHACSTPEATPVCEPVELELQPKLSAISRTWPDYACDEVCGDDAQILDDKSPQRVIEPKAHADIWLQVGPRMPGPANMYACRDLSGTPTCKLALPNWLAYDRADVGISKIEDIVGEGSDGEKTYGPGVNIGKIDEESMAYAAGLREDTVITAIGGFTVDRAAKARSMMAQFNAETPFMVTLQDGREIELVPVRKPKKK